MRCPRLWFPALLGASFVLTALAAPVRADFVTVTTTPISLTQTNWSPTTTSLQGVNPFQLDKFNTALANANVSLPSGNSGQYAQLTKIELKLDYRFDNTLQVRFDNLSTITVNAQGTMNVQLANSQTNLFTPATFTNSATLSSTPSDIFSKYVTVPTKSFTGTQTATITDQATLNQFLGTGKISLPAFAQASSSFTSSSGNGFGSSVTYAGASLSLVYTFAIVPEPSSFVLCGLGVAGLAFVGVRSRSGNGVKNDPPV